MSAKDELAHVKRMLQMPVYWRLMERLIWMAQHAEVANDGMTILRPPSQEEIASDIGSSREHVSRAMSKMQRTGLISTKRGGRHAPFIKVTLTQALISERDQWLADNPKRSGGQREQLVQPVAT